MCHFSSSAEKPSPSIDPASLRALIGDSRSHSTEPTREHQKRLFSTGRRCASWY